MTLRPDTALLICGELKRKSGDCDCMNVDGGSVEANVSMLKSVKYLKFAKSWYV